MAKITYTDKDKNGTGAVRQWTDTDANEVKASVNSLYDTSAFPKIGVFAYLPTPANTTITTLNVFQYIVGAFQNPIIELFTVSATPTPRIIYTGLITYYFEIDWQASVAANTNNTTVGVAIFKNGSIIPGSHMVQFCKTATDPFSFSGTCAIDLKTNDDIQLVVTSDGTGDIITFSGFTTTIRRFFS